MDDTLSDATNHVMIEDNHGTLSYADIGSPAPSLLSQHSQFKKPLVNQSII
jgi:hypothetical protein